MTTKCALCGRGIATKAPAVYSTSDGHKPFCDDAAACRRWAYDEIRRLTAVQENNAHHSERAVR